MDSEIINVAVCDDEALARSELEGRVERYMRERGYPHKICAFRSAGELLGFPERLDVVLLDIKMRGETGLEAAKELRKRGDECAIVFVTGLAEYVFEAFDVGAAQYLLKPVDEGKLRKVLDRVLRSRPAGRSLTVKRGGEISKIPLKSIIYCEVINRKVYVHASGGVIDYYGKMSELEQKLGEGFFRCHRSYVINLENVGALCEGQAKMTNGALVPVAKPKRAELARALLNLLDLTL